MVSISLRRTLIVAGRFWLADAVVYHAVLTFILILSVGAVVRRFSQSRS